MMTGLIASFTTQTLLAGYIVCIGGLNLICYLISGFYRRKFGEYSPRGGFLTAVSACGVLTILLFIDGRGQIQTIRILQIATLIIAGIASVWNSTSLYYTMERIRKQ